MSIFLILAYASACSPFNVYVPAEVIPGMLVASASVTVISIPPMSLTISFTASKFAVTNSVMSKSKFVFKVLNVSVGPPYEYA